MATLVYSDKCDYCRDVLQFIYDNPEVRPQIHVHDISNGIPTGISRVPSLMIGQDKILVGQDCKNYLMNMIAKEEQPVIGTGVHYVSIDGSGDTTNNQYCDLMDMDIPRAAPMTKEFEEKMRKKVE